jgi:hypothetical protein
VLPCFGLELVILSQVSASSFVGLPSRRFGLDSTNSFFNAGRGIQLDRAVDVAHEQAAYPVTARR